MAIVALFLCCAGGMQLRAVTRQSASLQSRRPSSQVARGQSVAPKKAATAPEQKLETLARELRQKKSAVSYERLRAWASATPKSTLSIRAALALGYCDYEKRRFDRALTWFQKAQRDPLLREYALYWAAETEQAQGRNAQALSDLEQFHKDYPESVLTEQALTALAEAAIAANQPQRALAVLESYPEIKSKPRLLFLEAEAQEQTGQLAAAANNYLLVYQHFPMSDGAGEAGLKIQALRRSLGSEFPEPTLQDQMARAEFLYMAHRWREARSEYQELMPRLAGQDRDRAELRIAECGTKLGTPPDVLVRLSLPEPDLGAERYYVLTDLYRSEKHEPAMLAAIEQAVQHDPSGTWAEEALFVGGNYFWVNLQRERAAEFYARVAGRSPSDTIAATAHWRVAWVAYLDGRPEAPALLQEQLQRFPNSPFTLSALYWLGRSAERWGSVDEARGYYTTVTQRYPQSYFGRLAAIRLRAVGASPVSLPGVLTAVSTLSPLRPFDSAIPPEAAERWQRAQALRSIAFDASAELELRAAYAATLAPSLIIEAAREANRAGHYLSAAVLVRQVFPDLESRQFEEVPEEVWRLAYPLPFLKEVQEAAKKSGLDPMLLAGVMRQESGFQPDAVSHADAIGLMQVLPKTARVLARRQKLAYSRKRLFDPGYNVRLGAIYLADLIRMFGGIEPALAAYNAGEDRVTVWRASRDFADAAEFVESIPFRETREYVEIVSRNAEIYRHLYAKPE